MGEIGDRIREARLLKKMTQEELALVVGYSGKSSISRIEKGQSLPSHDYIIKLAEALDVSASWLLGTEETDSILEKAFNERPEMRMLFSVAEDCTPEQIEQAIKIFEAIKN